MNKIRQWWAALCGSVADSIFLRSPMAEYMVRMFKIHKELEEKRLEQVAAYGEIIHEYKTQLSARDGIIRLRERMQDNTEARVIILSSMLADAKDDLRVERVVFNQQSEHIDELIEREARMRDSLAWLAQFVLHTESGYPAVYNEMKLKTDKSHGVRKDEVE